MSNQTISYRLEKPEDDAAIERLSASAFGPGRFARAAYRLRQGVAHLAELSFVGEADGALIGSVRLTPITIGDRGALLLGPLVVDQPWKGIGCGRGLVRTAVEAALAGGHRLVVLVGDLPYYQPLGFRRIEPLGSVTMPAPVDPARMLMAELVDGAGDGLSGDAIGGAAKA